MFGELRHLGGAVGRVPAGAGVAGQVHGEYLMFSASLVMGPESAAAAEGGLERLLEAVAPWTTGKDYLNFVEQPTDPRRLFADGDYARLQAVRAAVDPAGRMVGNHPVPAA